MAQPVGSEEQSGRYEFFDRTAETDAATKRIAYFDRSSMPDILIEKVETMVEVPDSIRENVDLAAYFDGQIRVQPLVAHPDDDGYSLGCYAFEPGFTIPRHWHDCDQVVLVVEGELHQGNKVLRPGEGYFTKANTPYSFTAGPNGCRILEFRAVSSFRTVYVDDDPARWKRPDER